MCDHIFMTVGMYIHERVAMGLEVKIFRRLKHVTRVRVRGLTNSFCSVNSEIARMKLHTGLVKSLIADSIIPTQTAISDHKVVNQSSSSIVRDPGQVLKVERVNSTLWLSQVTDKQLSILPS